MASPFVLDHAIYFTFNSLSEAEKCQPFDFIGERLEMGSEQRALQTAERTSSLGNKNDGQRIRNSSKFELWVLKFTI